MSNRAKNWEIISFLRADFLNSHEASGLGPAMREARAFEHILENIPLYYCDGELIAGDFGWHDGGGTDMARLLDDAKKISGTGEARTPSPEEKLFQEFHCFGGYTPAHTCVDYGKLLSLGVEGIVAEIKARQAKVRSPESYYLEAMSISLEALLKYSVRTAQLLEDTLSAGKVAPESLARMAAICRKVPRLPASDFREALQSVWLLHSTIGISEYSDASISLGSFDQYMLPFFRKSLEAGTCMAEMEELLRHFFVKLNRYGDAACTVNLGGMDKDGNDLCNPLTEMIIRVFCKGNYASPILAARIHRRTPQKIFDSLTVPELFARGQPTFYGEIPCRKALAARGVPADRIEGWAANSCMGLVIQGAEVSDMWGAVVNFLLPLELALNEGSPFFKPLPIRLKTRPAAKFAKFADLRAKFMEYLSEITDYCIANNRIATEKARQERPNPFISSFLDSCIERGQDRLSGGIEFHTVIVEAFGLINAADALSAVERLVFRERKYSLPELLAAVKADFKGHRAVLKSILDIPKYGNGEAEADKAAAELADSFAAMVSAYSGGNTAYAPSFHTLNVHIRAGRKCGASLDGRLAGEPLAKNIGTSPGKALKGYTSLMKSAAAIDQSKFSGGQALDISIEASLLKNPDMKRKLQSLLMAYFEMGGLQVQVNGLSADTLKAAVKDPDKYQDLIVRIAGYSDYFTRLGIDTQQEMIRRFDEGM